MEGRYWWILTLTLLLSEEDYFFSSVDWKRSCKAFNHFDEERLLKNLSSRSRKSIRPVLDSSRPITVKLGITFHHVIEVDESKQLFKSNVWVRQEWINNVWSWDPTEYDGVKSVVVSAQDVWLPDIVLQNNVFEEFDGRLDNVVTRIQIFHSGRCLWYAPFVFLTSCKIDVSNFPFDRQTCNLKFSSWVYTGKTLNLTGFGNNMTALMSDKRISNGEWEVVSIPVERKVRFYDALPGEPYPVMNFNIRLKRRTLFYIVNLVIPNFLITLLAFFSFFIPIECGERISFIITVLLSMTVFLLLVAESIPPTSDAVPVISIYFTASIVEVSLALIATGVSLRLNYSYIFGKNHLPRKFKRFLFGTLGPKLYLDTSFLLESEEKKEVPEGRKSFKNFYKKALKRRKPSLVQEGDVQMNSFSVQTALPNGSQKSNKYGPTVISSSSEENSDSFCSCSGIFNQEMKSQGTTGDDMGYRRNELSVIAEGVNVMIQTLEEEKETSKNSLESKIAAAILDRVFMCLFVIVFIVSSTAILLLPYIR